MRGPGSVGNSPCGLGQTRSERPLRINRPQAVRDVTAHSSGLRCGMEACHRSTYGWVPDVAAPALALAARSAGLTHFPLQTAVQEFSNAIQRRYHSTRIPIGAVLRAGDRVDPTNRIQCVPANAQ